MITGLAAFFPENATVESISEDQVRTFIRQRRRNTAPGSLRRELGVLKRILRMAVEEGIIQTNPASKFVVPREKVVTHSLTQEDYGKVLRCCPEWLKPIVQFSIATGLSRGELLALRWEDLEGAEDQLRLRLSKGKAARIIPLNNLAKHALETVRSEGTPATGQIFRGKSITAANISQTFMRACRAAEVGAVSYKDLRHTSATWMLQKGIGLGEIAGFLGHANVQTTARYLRQDHTELARAVKALDFMAIEEGRRRGKRSTST
jgi:integrase